MVGHSSFQFTFESHRESLIFEEGLKENLLKNIEVSLEFARRQVDPLQVKESGQLQKIWWLYITPRWAPPGWAWSTAPLALERPLSAAHSPTRSPKSATLQLFLIVLQVAIQLTGEPGTFTQGILVDVNSQSLCSRVTNLFMLQPAVSIYSGLGRVASWCRGSLTT